MPSSEQGVTDDRYRLIPRVLIFLFDDQDRVLLIRGAPTKRLWANRYNGVGGHVERGEDVLAAARRELVEETGLAARSMWLAGTITIDTGQQTGIVLFVYKGDYAGGILRESAEGALEWIHRQDLADLALVEDLYSLLPLVWGQQRGSDPFSARYFYDASGQLVITFSDSD